MLRKLTWACLLAAGLTNTTSVQANFLDDLESLEVRTGALYLQRSDNRAETLASDLAATRLLGSEQLGPGDDLGWELGIKGQIDATNAVEFRYFQLDQFLTQGGLSTFNGLVFNTNPLSGVGGDVGANYNYDVELSSFELNYRRTVREDLELIFGVRHVRDEEKLAGIIFGPQALPVRSNTLEIGANNYMTGFQIGADVLLIERGRFSAEALIKAGIYHNQASTTYSLDNPVGIAFAPEFGQGRKDVPAFVGEVQLTGVYRINESASARFGYQFMAMANVATAPNQGTSINGVSSGMPSMNVVATENPFYHGMFAQLEFFLFD